LVLDSHSADYPRTGCGPAADRPTAPPQKRLRHDDLSAGRSLDGFKEAAVSTIMPHPSTPEQFAWAVYIERLHVVVVLEPSYAMNAPPGLHLALSASRQSVDGVLVGNGWTPRVWLPRNWGRVVRVDLELSTS
jgi:hypothetical protein